MRALLLVAPARFDDPAALADAAAALPEGPRAALDGLLLAHGPGGTVPPAAVAAADDPDHHLWRMGALLPRVQPSPGAVLDPRQFARRCRLNPALTAVPALPGTREPGAVQALPPAPDAWWDAVIVAARVEAEPLRVTQSGDLRKDDERRLLAALGPDLVRWALALALAREARLLLPDGETWMGRPEARGRRISDPAALLPGRRLPWGARLLLRLADAGWRRIDAVAEALTGPQAAVVEAAGLGLPLTEVAAVLDEAAQALHRLGALDRGRASDGGVAFRAPTQSPGLPGGALITSDLEVIVAPGELSRQRFGRLARMAPYVSGDQAYRLRLTEAGVRLDQVAGGDDPLAWLEEQARFGLPDSVRSTVGAWLRTAGRVVLWTHARVVEEAGRFRRLEGPAPAGARAVQNGRDAPAELLIRGDELRVPFGADPLRLRARVGQVGRSLPADEAAWRWALAPADLSDAAAALRPLEAAHGGPLPGNVRAVVRAPEARRAPPAEGARVVRVPRRLRAALLADPTLAAVAHEVPGLGALVVRADDVEAAQARLDALGVPLALAPPEA